MVLSDFGWWAEAYYANKQMVGRRILCKQTDILKQIPSAVRNLSEKIGEYQLLKTVLIYARRSSSALVMM
jgi:hypothetical protein